MNFASRALLTACSVACWLVADPAFAQPVARCGEDATAEQTQAARAQFVRAQSLLAAADAARAERALRDVLAVYDSPNARLVLGRALVRLSRFAEAYEEFDRALRDATECAQRDEDHRQRYASTISSSVQARDSVAPRVALLLVRTSAAVSSATLTIDGASRAFEPSRAVALAPGEARVSLESEGFFRADATVSLSAGRLTELPLALRPRVVLDARTTVARGAPEPAAPAARGGNAGLASGVTVASLGAASAIAAAVLLPLAQGEYDAIDRACPAVGCDPALLSRIDQGEIMQRAGLALAITGGALIVSGVIVALATRAPRERGVAPSAARCGGLSCTFAF